MSDSRWIASGIRTGAWLLAIAGLGATAVIGWRRLGGHDPYASLTAGARHVTDPGAAIRIEGAKIRHYEDGKLVAQADAKDMTVSQDRSTVRMDGIRNGLFNTKEGAIQFAGKMGLLNPGVKAVSVSGGVRVAGKGFDISTSTVTIDGRTGIIRAPSPLQGKILGGTGFANNLEWQPNADRLRIKGGSWQGKLPSDPQVGPNGRRTWNIDFNGSERGNGKDHYEDARATDGEVIVMAPLMDREIKTDIITAVKQGDRRPTYRSAKADIVADKVVIYRKDSRAEFSGNVVMYVRPKKDWDKPLPGNDVKVDEGNQPLLPEVPKALQKGKDPDAISQAERDRDEELRSGKTLRDYPINMRAEQVTYWYKKGQRHAIAKGGNPTAWQQFTDGRWRQMWAPEAHYDAEKDMLDLVGNNKDFQVIHKNSVGDAFQTIALTVSIREDQTEDDEYMKTKMTRAIYQDRDNPEDPRGAPDQKKTPPPAQTPPPKNGG